MKFLTILFLTTISFAGNTQSNIETLLRDAKEFNASFLQKDFEKHVDYTVSYVVDLAGGRDLMADNVKAMYDMMTQGGTQYESIEALEPGEIITAGKELHTILPQKVINKYGDTRFSKTGYFLAVSQNDGKSWTFLDLEPYDVKSLKTFVISWTGELEVPEVDIPQLIED